MRNRQIKPDMKITNIQEIDTTIKILNHTSRASGYIVNVGDYFVKMLIEDESQCCENWGYICSEDNIDEFIGAELLNINFTDGEYNTKTLEEFRKLGFNINSGEQAFGVFITFETSKGQLQFTLYNDHNGYYGHNVLIESNIPSFTYFEESNI